MAQRMSNFEENWGAPLSSFLEVHLLPHKLYRTALRRRTVQETSINNERVDRDGKLQRPLSALAFAMMGVGTIVATGIFSFLPYICASSCFRFPLLALPSSLCLLLLATSSHYYRVFRCPQMPR